MEEGNLDDEKMADMEEGNDEDDDAASIESGDGLGLEECLFCSTVANSVESNLQHMSVKHSFFIPDVSYCADVDGLIAYLGKYCF